MKKLNLIFILLIIAITSILAQPVSNSTLSRVMIVNGYSRDIFIRITDSRFNVILETGALTPDDVSFMLSTPKDGFFFVSYKYSESGDWVPFPDDSYDEGYEDYMIQLQSGLVCCIVIDRNCDIDEHTLVLPDSDMPLVCFCNLSDTTLSRMEIGIDYMIDFCAFTTNIKPFGMTDFTAIDPGNYGLAWATAASAAKDEYSWLSNEDDTQKLLTFENDNFYVYCIHKTDASQATLFTITP